MVPLVKEGEGFSFCEIVEVDRWEEVEMVGGRGRGGDEEAAGFWIKTEEGGGATGEGNRCVGTKSIRLELAFGLKLCGLSNAARSGSRAERLKLRSFVEPDLSLDDDEDVGRRGDECCGYVEPMEKLREESKVGIGSKPAAEATKDCSSSNTTISSTAASDSLLSLADRLARALRDVEAEDLFDMPERSDSMMVERSPGEVGLALLLGNGVGLGLVLVPLLNGLVLRSGVCPSKGIGERNRICRPETGGVGERPSRIKD